MPRAYSDDLKARIPTLYADGMNVAEICDVLGVKRTLVYSTLRLHSEYGLPHHPGKIRRGRCRILSGADVDFIDSLVEHENTLYLDEIRDRLSRERDVHVSVSTIKRTGNRLSISRKQVTVAAKERNELLRAAFLNKVAELVTHPDMLLCTDESSKDDRTVARQSGYARIGTRCHTRAPFIRGKRCSILPLLSIDGYIALDIVEGAVTGEVFERFLREQVAPLMRPYPGPRSVLLLDNCSIHHGPAVRQIIEEETGGVLLYLPLYSPDYNPIEQSFSSLKAWLRRNYIPDIDKDTPLTFLHSACDSITAEKAEGWYRASGYM